MSTLRIGRLRNSYRLPAGTASAALSARLDEVASQQLPSALERTSERMPEVSAEEVWLVRALHVDVTVGAGAVSDAAAISDAWSLETTRALRRTLDGGSSTDVVRFANRAAWTAKFVAELASGKAWDAWYFGAFSSLRALPTGRAVAEAFAREPSEAADVLAEVVRLGALERMLLACGPGDARRVADVVAPSGRMPTTVARDLARTLARMPAAMRSPDDPHPPGSVVRLLAHAAANGVALGPGAAEVAAAITSLAGLAVRRVAAAAVADAVARRRWAEALRLSGREPADATGEMLAALETLADMSAGADGWLAQLTEQLAVDTAKHSTDEPCETATRYGGLLLLWPSFAACWPSQLEDAAGDDAPLWRLLVAAHLYGPDDEAALRRDTVLAWLCGLDRPPTPERLADARTRLPDAFEPATLADDVLRDFAARLPGFTTSSPTHVRRNFLDVPATVQRSDARWSATVAGPPLQVVLRMAGMHDVRYALPWPPGSLVEVELRWT